MSDFEKFAQINILQGLTEEKQKKLFNQCKRLHYEKGEIIMEEGEKNYSMFFFLEGEVVVSSTMTMKARQRGGGFSEVEKSLVKLNAGQVSILGEMSVFEELPRSATVKAYSSCTLYEINRKNFRLFVATHPESGVNILMNIAEILCHRVRSGNRDIIKLSTALSIALTR